MNRRARSGALKSEAGRVLVAFHEARLALVRLIEVDPTPARHLALAAAHEIARRYFAPARTLLLARAARGSFTDEDLALLRKAAEQLKPFTRSLHSGARPSSISTESK
jgi:Tfp pilus assembly protein PilF